MFEKDGLPKNVPLACYSTLQRADAIGETLSIAGIEKVIMLYLVNQFKDMQLIIVFCHFYLAINLQLLIY